MALDLLEVLGQATEAVNNDNPTDFSPIDTAAPAIDYTEDFGPEPAIPEAEADEDEPTAAPLPTPEDARKSARRWIDFIDNMQKPALIASYRNAILRPGDEARMDAYEQERAGRGRYSIEDAVTDDKDFYYVLARAKEFAELCDKAAFTEDEKQSLTDPLAEVLEKHSRLQLSPEMALLLAVAMVMLPRVAPLIPQFRKGFNL
ncbi:MAG: hypothetical protein ACRYFZ_00915 [Janthinobacterium lividum]